MSWIGAAIGAVGSILGAKASAKGVAEANEQQWEHTKELYQNRYQWQAKDMKAAGLNPILAATGGGLSAPVTSAPQVQNEAAPLMQGIGMALNSAVSFMQAASKEKEADAALKTAEANEKNAVTNEKNLTLQERIGDSVIKSNLAQAGMFDATTGYYNILGPATSAKYNAEIQQIYADIENSTRKISAEIRNLDSGTALNYAQCSKVAEEIRHIAKTTQILDLDINSFERKLRSLTAKQQYEYLLTTLGEIQNKTGFGLGLLNPFDRGGVSSNGNIGFGMSR